MKRNLYVGRTLFAFVPLLTISSAAQAALANRVFVSQRAGNDTNACNNILTPCQTFAGAVLQLNPGGEAIVLDSGGYGPVTITQSVTIEASPGVLAFIHPPTPVDAISVNAPGATVVLRGLTIDGAGQTMGSAIHVVAVAALHVENCVMTGFAGTGIPDGHGIYFTSANQLFVKDTIIRGNAGYGIWVIPSSGTAQASVDRCRLEQNNSGLVSDSQAGGTAKVTIRDSVASGSVFDGLQTFGGGELNAEGCLIADNGHGLESDSGGSTLRASNCTVTDNNVGLNASGGSLLSRQNNTVQGNIAKGSFTGTYSAD
jgi:Right handed beta helix region